LLPRGRADFALLQGFDRSSLEAYPPRGEPQRPSGSYCKWLNLAAF